MTNPIINPTITGPPVFLRYANNRLCSCLSQKIKEQVAVVLTFQVYFRMLLFSFNNKPDTYPLMFSPKMVYPHLA